MTDPADSKHRFTDRVADYRSARPGYPPELVATLAELVGLTPDWVVADLGSGTGLSTKPFLEYGNTVVGVEPNQAMRKAGEDFLHEYSHFRSQAGAAEATGLPAASVDLVIAAQAFHWFDVPETHAECLRILREPHWAALIWNVRLTDADEFARGYESLLERWGTDYMAYRARRIGPDELRTFFGTQPEERSMSNRQIFDFDGLCARVLSSSYVPAQGHPDHDPMMDELQRLFSDHAAEGQVRFEYETQIFAARVT